MSTATHPARTATHVSATRMPASVRGAQLMFLLPLGIVQLVATIAFSISAGWDGPRDAIIALWAGVMALCCVAMAIMARPGLVALRATLVLLVAQSAFTPSSWPSTTSRRRSSSSALSHWQPVCSSCRPAGTTSPAKYLSSAIGPNDADGPGGARHVLLPTPMGRARDADQAVCSSVPLSYGSTVPGGRYEAVSALTVL
jgi:hypothetical protein